MRTGNLMVIRKFCLVGTEKGREKKQGVKDSCQIEAAELMGTSVARK